LARLLHGLEDGEWANGPFSGDSRWLRVASMALIAAFRDLTVWQKSINLAAEAYALAASLPRRDQFELASQIRRAAASVPANIAEGHNGRSRREFANHIAIALGSLAELESHLELAIRLQVIEVEGTSRILGQAAEVNRMLHALARGLKAPPRT
jgi:four helix bundle protein